MFNLKQVIKDAEKKKVAIGHFNISNLEQLKAIFGAGKELFLPLIIGTSEGEGNFIGFKQAAVLVKSLREDYTGQVFLNADHIHSLEKAKEAAEAGYDAITFDVSELPFEENLKKTKEAVKFIKSINPEILVEGEIGFIGGSSKILKEIPKGAAIKAEDLTKPEEAGRFVKETGVDLLAPAVGNIHGMFTRRSLDEGGLETLDIFRIKEIKKASGVPLVLHGGSGITNEDFLAAIDAGISIIHINTELRWVWRRSLEKSLRDNPEEITPYKIMPEVIEEIKKVVLDKLRIFNKL